ncbi:MULTISPECIES: hypothetical protein [unclassified Microcoleus]|uniref:hypothetical protein n=1 Tax=unclassified Microcoleus TaxID=2642155 RepID=UPI0025F90752|nr:MULTISPECIES: hypothetical protein [unclassified Microcoleus]
MRDSQDAIAVIWFVVPFVVRPGVRSYPADTRTHYKLLYSGHSRRTTNWRSPKTTSAILVSC